MAMVSKGARLESVLCDTSTPGVKFVGVEENALSPLAVIESAGFSKALSQMAMYDYVIIDTPALNEYADAIVLGKKVDAVLLVVREMSTHREEIEAGAGQLQKAGIKLTGVIMDRHSKTLR